MNKHIIVIIKYYNVEFYLYLQNESDLFNVKYFIKNIDRDIRMQDIFVWCKNHNVSCTTKFKYRKDFPMTANLWNFYSYIRVNVSMKYCNIIKIE